MKLAIKFPVAADSVYAEAETFRKLSPTDRFLSIIDLIAAGERMMAESPRREEAARMRQAQEEAWQRAQRELFTRHGH